MNIDPHPPSKEHKRRVSYMYHPNIGDFHYGEKHYMKPARVKMTHSLVTAYGLQDYIEILTPRPASFREMAKFHCDEYLDFLKRVTPEDSEEILKYQARFNVGEYCPDCPVFEGVYEFCSLSAGGSIIAAKRINQGVADIAINWGGGLHHAKRSEASGFCYVNDIVLAIVELLKYYQRVLYIDTDVHHGDGVEEAFYSTDRVMCLSLHKFGEFFPGTGALNDIGVGKGRYYSVNVPLNDGIDDESYQFIFNSVVEHIMNWYRPGVVVLQLGADSLVGDRLGAFNLSMRGHAQSVRFLKKFDVPFLMVGGGGYTIRNVARAWCYETSVAAGVDLIEDLPYHEYFEYYHPNYLLDVTASNMENLNTREYLEKIRMVVIENLRHVAHAPSVEHHPIPVEYWSSSEEEDDAVLDCYSGGDDACMRCSNNSSDSELSYCLPPTKKPKDSTVRAEAKDHKPAKHKSPQGVHHKIVDPAQAPQPHEGSQAPTLSQNHAFHQTKTASSKKGLSLTQTSPASNIKVPHLPSHNDRRGDTPDGLCVRSLTKSPPPPPSAVIRSPLIKRDPSPAKDGHQSSAPSGVTTQHSQREHPTFPDLPLLNSSFADQALDSPTLSSNFRDPPADVYPRQKVTPDTGDFEPQSGTQEPAETSPYSPLQNSLEHTHIRTLPPSPPNPEIRDGEGKS